MKRLQRKMELPKNLKARLLSKYVGEDKNLNVCNIQYVGQNFSVCW